MQRAISLPIVLLIVAGLVLLTAAAIEKSFWEDEAWTASVADSDLSAVVDQVSADQHAPLYFLSIALWGRIFGRNELALRSLSILWMIPVYGLTFLLAAQIQGRRAAIFATAVVCLSPFLAVYAHNARYYSMASALSLTVVFAMNRFLKSERSRFAFLGLYILAGTALIYTVYTAVSVLLACNLCWLAQWKREKRDVRGVAAWILAQLIIAILFLPWLPRLSSATGGNFNPEAISPGLFVEAVKRAAYLGFAFGVGESLSPLNLLAWAGLIGVLGALLAVLYYRPSGWTLPVFFFVFIAVFNILLSTVLLYPDSAWQGVPNRILYAFPFFALVVGGGLAAMPSRLAVISSVVLVVVFVASLSNYFTGRQFIKPHLSVDWNEILGKIRAESRDDARVICNDADFACPYYVERYGFQPYSRRQWPELAQNHPAEVWWIQINVGAPAAVISAGQAADADFIREVGESYPHSEIYRFAPQDPSIRRLKSEFLQQEDYEYRVEVFRFSDQLGP